jgi:hypothetical protein
VRYSERKLDIVMDRNKVVQQTKGRHLLFLILANRSQFYSRVFGHGLIFVFPTPRQPLPKK